MTTVTIPLNRYLYRFRKLTYREEFALAPGSGAEGRKAVLAAALTEVSGFTIPSAIEANRILGTVPVPVQNRLWVLYRAGVAEDRFFSTKGLYRAPDPRQLHRAQEETEDQRANAVDRSMAAMEQKFGRKEIAETMATERRLVEDARRRGALQRATPDEVN